MGEPRPASAGRGFRVFELGCSVCPWAAARPLAVRAASLRLGASSRSPARPCRRPRAPQPGPPVPPAPSTPVGPVVLRTIRLVRGPPWPCHRRPAPRPGPATAHGHRSQVLRTLRRHGRSLWRPCLPVLLLVVPLVFRAPRGLSRGPGCLVRPWAAARPLAVRAASFARRVASRRALALPPPTGTAARFSGPAGGLHTGGACCAEDDSPRLEARPGPAAADQHRGLAPPPPTGTLAGPTAPLAPRPGPPFPPTLSCGVRVLDRKFCCG